MMQRVTFDLFRWCILVVFLAAVGSGVTARGQAPAGSGNAAPAVAEATASGRKDDKLYVLTFNDVIQMAVYQEEDLSAKVRVGKDGTVSLPLLGSVSVGGKTLEQATSHITALLAKDYLVNPQVSLSIAEYSKRRFTVLGHVTRPGTYELPNEEELNLLQAIAMAGGYTRLGAPWKITVQRVVEGEQRIFRLDADAMSKDKRSKPFIIQADDTITVGEKLI